MGDDIISFDNTLRIAIQEVETMSLWVVHITAYVENDAFACYYFGHFVFVVAQVLLGI